MIKKILKLFPRQNNKTYNLGILQKIGYIETLGDISSCPSCKSKDITWKFFIPTDGSKPTEPSYSICNDCDYKDEKGGFEKTNKALYRQNKINQILDEFQ